AQDDIVLPKFRTILAQRSFDPINDNTVPEQLHEIGAMLRLPPEKQGQALIDVISSALRQRVAQIEKTGRISSDEYDRIFALARKHHIDLEGQPSYVLAVASLCWNVEQGHPLPQ